MKKILIVDDDLDLSETIKSVLELEGYTLSISNAPQAGIKLAKEQQPDLIIMDVLLPEMNGAEVVKILKSDPVVKNIPVIFLSGLVSTDDDLQGGMQVGGKHYQILAKPFENKRLVGLVKSILKD